jgi:membrane-associated phospholipid phosphatase
VTISAQNVDSVKVSPVWYQKKAVAVLLAPALLIGAGIATINDRGLYSSQDAYECIQRNYPDFQTNIDDYLQFVPAVAVYGLNIAGVKGKNNFVDRSFLYLFSISIAAATTSVLKNTTHVLRPDGSDYRSFPSGHATSAFVSATFLHEEYKDVSLWYSVAGYSIATATGVIRMMNNKHWLSDVLVGAGIGILTTKAVYLVYPPVKKYFVAKCGNRNSNKLSIIPYAYPANYGIFLQYNLD